MTDIVIVIAESKDKERWDSYVESHPDASPYHLFAWKEAVEQAYGHKGYYLIAEENKTICGVLPAIHMKLPFMVNQLVALPFCDFGKALARNNLTEKKLIGELSLIGKKLNCGIIEIRNQEEYSCAENSPGTDINVNKVRMILDLPGSSGQLFSGFKSKLRSQIRKAEKNGLAFRWGEENDLERFYAVFCKNMLELGSPVHSRKWFHRILKCYGDNCRMGLVELDGMTVGGGIILIIRDKISIPWASTLREFNRYSPNMLLYWNLMRFASDGGFAFFDLGRSSVDSGTYKFKEQWGASPIKLIWHNLNISGKNEKDNFAKSMDRSVVAMLWRKMPLHVANMLGPVIRKHVSL